MDDSNYQESLSSAYPDDSEGEGEKQKQMKENKDWDNEAHKQAVLARGEQILDELTESSSSEEE